MAPRGTFELVYEGQHLDVPRCVYNINHTSPSLCANQHTFMHRPTGQKRPKNRPKETYKHGVRVWRYTYLALKMLPVGLEQLKDRRALFRSLRVSPRPPTLIHIYVINMISVCIYIRFQNTYIYVHVCVYECMYMYVCMYIYIYIYIYIYAGVTISICAATSRRGLEGGILLLLYYNYDIVLIKV